MLFETYFSKIAERMPRPARRMLEAAPFHPLFLVYQMRERLAMRKGPPYTPSHDRIIIDITASCDLNCIDCCRSCGFDQAMSTEHMGMEQVGRFISQSISQSRRWKEIVLEGGEPTLHPELSEILDLLLDYKYKHSSATRIKVLTNGYSERSRNVIGKLSKKKIAIFNSNKKSNRNLDHCGFNCAPCDLAEFKHVDFSQGCYLPTLHGLGLTKHGYYPHPICGGIDRVFGFDIGRRYLPDADDPMKDLFTALCPLCGFFRFAFTRRTRKEISSPGQDPAKETMSSAWVEAYKEYRDQKPTLSDY